jgi:hypothetical protein
MEHYALLGERSIVTQIISCRAFPTLTLGNARLEKLEA